MERENKDINSICEERRALLGKKKISRIVAND
jgi:hypothetical protein